MLTQPELFSIGILAFACIILCILLNYISRKKNKKILDEIFIVIFILFIFWMSGLTLQIIFNKIYNVNPIYFEYLTYIAICYMPVAFFFMAIIFARTKVTFKKIYLLLFIIPTLSVVMLWTNDLHHLFYEQYSTEMSRSIFGPYMYVHSVYTYILYAISLFILIKYSIKNSGFFSKSAILIFAGALVPILTNILGFTGILPMSIYVTPITFTFTIICLTFAIFKFNLFKTTPIALQRIVDKISDSYVVLNDDLEISDFNETFISTFKIKNASTIRGTSFIELLNDYKLNEDAFLNHIDKIKYNNNTESFEVHINKIDKYFNAEVNSIIIKNQSFGILILLKDITQHKKDVQAIKDNQEILMESERLASLGQLVGGIAHNLKTPIMSISGAVEGLTDLVNEFDASVGNPVVTNDDFHDIAKDMNEWLEKIRSYTEYMSDILTAVKGQAVTLSNDSEITFTVSELFKRVDILMKHELKKAVVYLKTSIQIDENTIIKGDVNSLVQVVNNMISNSIQAYNGKPEQTIDLSANKNGNNIIISVRDYGSGLPDKVKQKLFKEMITTKGKNGTGLGLYMSYSNIRAHFHGDITFETETGKGTTFNIIIPL